MCIRDRLCTSRRLFKRATPIETYEAIQKGEVPDPCSVSQAVSRQVADVILKALARNRDDRYPSAEAMQEALELAMRRSGLKGRPLDLSRFLESDVYKRQVSSRRRTPSASFVPIRRSSRSCLRLISTSGAT